MTQGAETTVRGLLASVFSPVGRWIVGYRAHLVLGFAVLLTVLVCVAIAGAALNDRAVAANSGYADAEVLEGSSPARTLVRFTVANGEVVVPVNGVSYPRGLVAGQRIAVEYDVTDPDLVKVAGRTALGESPPLLGGVVVAWLVLGPTAWWLRRRGGSPAPPPAP